MARRAQPAPVAPGPVSVDTSGCAFDKDVHAYTIDGVPVVSVTQVLNEIGFVDFSRIPPGILAEAQARGTYVHTCLHYHLEGDLDLADVHPPFLGYVESALAYLAVAGLTPLTDAGGKPCAVEYRFWNRERRFAGTIDYVAYDPDGTLAILDWKTGQPSDVAAPLQTAAYEFGLRSSILAGHPFPIRRRAIKLFKDGTRGRVDAYDVEQGHDYQHDLGLFFAALSCVNYKRNGLRHGAA